MLSGSCFFHRANQGTGLGVQAGIGNFVVRIVPFVTPWIIGFALVVGTPQVMVNEDTGVTKDVWFQNAGYVRTRPFGFDMMLSFMAPALFFGLGVGFALLAAVIPWWFYARPEAPTPC